jgi:hypothetical protein
MESKIDRELIHLLKYADEIIVVYRDKRATLDWDLRERMVDLMKSEIGLSDLRRFSREREAQRDESDN